LWYNIESDTFISGRRQIEMPRITTDTIIADVLRIDRGTIPIFLNNGLHCLGCPSAQGESIEEACALHGIDAQKLVDELNEYLKSKGLLDE